MSLRFLRAAPVLVALPLAPAIVPGCGPVTADLTLGGSPDAAAADAGRGEGSSGAMTDFWWDASACAPGDVQTFRPGDYVPASPPRNACTAAEVAAFYELCLGPKVDMSACIQWEGLHAECFRCVLTPSSDATYGPIIDYTHFVEANVAGCVELESQGVSCARSVQALASCQLAACAVNCPVRDATSLEAFQGCTTQAEATGCSTYAQAASCFSSQSDAAPLSVCAVTDFYQFYMAVVPLFCSASADAGAATPGPLDASPD
jgi:hypothetical protein